MRLLESFSILLLLFAMVSCGALGCSWEKTTDNRGLSRHRASCHLFKRSSILATQKRQQRARDATLGTLVPKFAQSVNTSRVSDLPTLNGNPSLGETSTDSKVPSLPYNILQLVSTENRTSEVPCYKGSSKTNCCLQTPSKSCSGVIIRCPRWAHSACCFAPPS